MPFSIRDISTGYPCYFVHIILLRMILPVYFYRKRQEEGKSDTEDDNVDGSTSISVSDEEDDNSKEGKKDSLGIS